MADVSQQYINTFLNILANELVNGMVRRVPVDTGLLRNSIRYEVVDNKITFYMTEYAVYVEYGTSPHIITAKNAKSLSWKKDGKTFFAKSVRHPGTQAQPFIRPTFHQDFGKAVEIAAKAAESVL